MKPINILFVGGGNMASAMIGGLIAKGFDKQTLFVVEPLPETRNSLSERYGVRCFATAMPEALAVDVIVLAIKPQLVQPVAEGLRPLLSTQLVVSIAAGIRLDDLSRWLGGYNNIVRAMPNTPALIRCGITGLFAPPSVSAIAKEQTLDIIGAIGTTFWVDQEDKLDGVTAVSGSGPAYVFYLLETLQNGARNFGFDDTSARQMAIETVTGAAQLAARSPENFSTLRQQVTSKGGTTEAALKTMEESGVAKGILAGMQAALERSRKMGLEFGNRNSNGTVESPTSPSSENR